MDLHETSSVFEKAVLVQIKIFSVSGNELWAFLINKPLSRLVISFVGQSLHLNSNKFSM